MITVMCKTNGEQRRQRNKLYLDKTIETRFENKGSDHIAYFSFKQENRQFNNLHISCNAVYVLGYAVVKSS